MKLKIAVLTVAAALLGASAAFATPPAGKGNSANTPASTHAAKPTVMFVLHGTVMAYTAVNGTTAGSVQLKVTSSNHAASSLKGQTLTFAIGTSAKVTGTVTVGHNATVKVRAAKASAASLASASSIFQLIDQGASS